MSGGSDQSGFPRNGFGLFKAITKIIWSILEIVRTVFAAAGGEESPQRNSEIAAPPRR